MFEELFKTGPSSNGGNTSNSFPHPNPPQKKTENLTLLEAQRQRNLGKYFKTNTLN